MLFHKKVLVTGASSGIGRETALLLAKKGFEVVAVARRKEKLIELSCEAEGYEGTISVLDADVSDPSGRARVFEESAKLAGHIDVLVNNAGEGWYGWFAEMPRERIESMMSLNALSVVDLTRFFLPGMIERGFGRIINIGSISGSLPSQGIALYGATKAFLDSFTSALRRELRGTGVKAGVIRAGPVKTDFGKTTSASKCGMKLPTEGKGIRAEKVARCVLARIQRMKRVTWVPWYYAGIPLAESLFGPLIDALGPLLLKRGR